MKLALLCLFLASTASAAPSVFHLTPHYGASRQQTTNPFTGGHALPPMVPGGYSIELIYPHTFGTGGQPLSTQGFIKYSIPQPAGRQSVEVYYPYDFAQQRIVPNLPPMTNVPQGVPFDLPLPGFPQQTLNNPLYDANPHPSQNPLPPVQQDQPVQANQIPAKQ